MARPPDPTAKISLLRASETVFAEKGLQLAKVEDITRLAGLSKGAFYLHFESKEEAFKQVVESFLARCTANLPPPADIPLPDGAEGVLAQWLDLDTQMYEFLWQNRAIVTILQGCQGEYEYLYRAFNEGVHKQSVDWLELWKKKGYIRKELDSDLGATILSGAHQAIVMKVLSLSKKPQISEVLAKAQAVFVRGFGTPLLIDALENEARMDNPPVSQRTAHASHSSKNRPSNKRRANGGNAKVS